MVKLLAELHGGTVAVASAPGEGSCFTVWLPFRAAAPPVIAPGNLRDVGIEPHAPGSSTALVVEDDFRSAE